jgi:hypothetical protein
MESRYSSSFAASSRSPIPTLQEFEIQVAAFNYA